MKYFIVVFVTAILVFLGATIYYKGLPNFSAPTGVSVTTQEAMPTPTSAPSPSPIDETTAIVNAVKAALVAEHGQDAASLNVTVSKIEGDYAKGSASAQAGGGMWFAAKVNGIWKLVWDGNGQINCSDIAPYPAFPTDMIPECWDTTTNKVITR
ncbi:MAG TPA: hypothetical protein VMR19_04100 [Candidatus Saccharimonadales bacterium]|jgi:hypothetical protein|nr:hypothetical protein [Candidatus Saccharimonadales bacterium]